MKNSKLCATWVFIFFVAIGCTTKINPEVEKAAIIKTLNDETKHFFNRDYAAWKSMWVQESFVAKTYMKTTDSTFSETLGWAVIDDFGKKYISEHPKPDPLPTLLNEVFIRLYDNAAWVNFEQQDAIRGLKRETRLMEKVNGQWKIAGMHTTIYGLKSSLGR
jgi:hypothetical protein